MRVATIVEVGEVGGIREQVVELPTVVNEQAYRGGGRSRAEIAAINRRFSALETERIRLDAILSLAAAAGRPCADIAASRWLKIGDTGDTLERRRPWYKLG